MQAALQDEDDDDVQVDFMKLGKKKKKKKKDGKGKEKAKVIAAEESKEFNWNIEGHKQYEYSELLDRIETIMNKKVEEQEEEAKD